MSTSSLKRLKRRLIPLLAFAAAIAPPAAQAKPMLEGGSSSTGTSVVIPASGLDQTRVIPGYNAPQLVTATRPDDRGTRASFVDELQQPVPVTASTPSGGFSWGDASYGLLIGLVGALAIAAAVVGLRRQKQAEPTF